MYPLTVLGARNPRSRCRQDLTLGEAGGSKARLLPSVSHLQAPSPRWTWTGTLQSASSPQGRLHPALCLSPPPLIAHRLALGPL